MSDRPVPPHLRNPNEPPKHLKDRSRKNWIRNATKELQNYFYAQDYPPLNVPTSLYTIVHVHEHTSNETMQTVIDHVQTCHEFSLDTESEMIWNNTLQKKVAKLALIQVQTISFHLPSVVILVELAHLPPADSSLMTQIRLLFQELFKSGNKLYAWGLLDHELSPAKSHRIFNWPIQASKINLQDEFNGWYERALPRCEACCLAFSNIIVRDGTIDAFTICRCPCYYPYSDLSLPWSLQNAMAYAYGLFLDKSMTKNKWTAGLDTHYSTLPIDLKQQMIHYAASDCFGVTLFIRPIEQKWSLQHLKTIDIADLFHTSRLEYEPISEDEIDIIDNINVIAQSPGYELVSEEEEPIRSQTSPQSNERNIDNDPTVEQVPPIILNTNQRRTIEARRRRNQHRNHIYRSHRYQFRIVRPIYTRFTMFQIKQTLRARGIHIKHVKIEDRDQTLIIGVKNQELCEIYERQIPTNLFDREHYYHSRAHSVRSRRYQQQ